MMKYFIRCLMSAMLFLMGIFLMAQQEPSDGKGNPFMVYYPTPFETPPFDRIRVEHFLPAIEEGIKIHETEIQVIVSDPNSADYANTIEALDKSGQFLENVTAVFQNQLAVQIDTEIMSAAKKILPLLADHKDSVTLNSDLFARIKRVYAKRNELKLNAAQEYILQSVYREFLRNGALLSEDRKERLRNINKEISFLSMSYKENVKSESDKSFIVIGDRSELAGLPDWFISKAEETANEMQMKGKWVVTTQTSSFITFMQHSDIRNLRRDLYDAYYFRCDRDNDYDNKEIFQKILSLRAEKSKMLGYPTPAHYYLEERMAKNPEEVQGFLGKIWAPALRRAKKESVELQAIIENEKGGFKLAPWDWWYYSEKLRKIKYSYDDSEIRCYFKMENVRDGIFYLCNKLYGLKFYERKDIPLYHHSVSTYEVHGNDGTILGIIYLDLFPRSSKRSGAWSSGYRNAFAGNNERVLPLITIVANFTSPSNGCSALLSAEEVKTFFHEFGHALRSLFANRSHHYYIPLDAAELPSQIMENWAFEPELLRIYAKHYQTGKIIPELLLDKMTHASLFNKGFETISYLASAILDMAWHSLETAKNRNVTKYENDLMKDLGLISEINPRIRSTFFIHIISSYPAGYYSYAWSEILDADAFQAFKETSLFNRKTAESFRKIILERLGTEDVMTLYKEFRGKEPDIKPLLKRRGLDR